VQEYLVNEIQEVYRMQGVKINDKHIEVIVRNMMAEGARRGSGRHEVPRGRPHRQARLIDRERLCHRRMYVESKVTRSSRMARSSRKAGPGAERGPEEEEQEGGGGARGAPGHLRADPSGHHPGFAHDRQLISAASFQETTKVLTDAAIEGKVDSLLD